MVTVILDVKLRPTEMLAKTVRIDLAFDDPDAAQWLHIGAPG